VEFSEKEAVVEVISALKPVKVFVPKYPILEKKREMYFCIHPENILLGLKEHKNVLFGAVENIIPVLQGLRVVVNAYGIKLCVSVTKNSFNYKIGDKVWLSFDKNSIHPLCGKRSRLEGKKFPLMCIKKDAV